MGFRQKYSVLFSQRLAPIASTIATAAIGRTKVHFAKWFDVAARGSGAEASDDKTALPFSCPD